MLVEHEIASTRNPAVEVIVDGSPAITPTFELTVSLRLRDLITVLRDALLVALHGGDVVVSAHLSP